MTNERVQLMLALVVLASLIHLVSCQGRLWDPPGRSTKWRRGFLTPINNDDDRLNCGGLQHQISLGYKCGLCGDPYDGPRNNEAGGLYATGIITNTYTKEQQTVFQVNITKSQKGYFEFKICPTNDTARETQECFDLYPVQLADGSGTRYTVGQTGLTSVNVVLPSNLTCSACVLQWRYHTGSNSGTDLQEEFYGCADIKILDASKSGETQNSFSEKSTTTKPREKRQVCRGSYGQTRFDEWCRNNCAGGFCPPSHCVC